MGLNPSPSQEPHGLSLPSRRAQITVTRRSSLQSQEEDDSVSPLGAAGAKRDSLEGTRRYYNVESPVMGQSASDTPRARTISNTTGPRPLSATPSETSFSNFRSPSRGSVPLPTPRGFLAPQKPAAARRLETRERYTTVSTTGLAPEPRAVGGGFDATTPTAESDFSHTFSIEPPAPPTTASPFTPAVPARSSAAAQRAASPTGPAPAAASITVNNDLSSPAVTPRLSRIAPRHPDTPTRPGESIEGHGTTWEDDQSSPTHPPRRDLSSDHLVDTVRSNSTSTEKGGMSTLRKVSQKTYPDAPEQSALIPTKTRRYKNFENKNSTWLCGGRLMTGGDSPVNFIGSIILILGISGVWLGTTGAWLWRHGHEYGMAKGAGIAVTIVFVYLFGLTVSSMIAASFREPGILPRQLDPDPPYTPVDVYWEANPREIRVGPEGKDKISCKYCETCKSYRPPRCSHCRLCGNCVEGIDHHCAYLHGCIGQRNYFSFIVFVISAAAADIYIVVFSAIQFSMICHHEHVSFKRALQTTPGSAVSFILGVLVLPPILFLFWYHVRLLLYNLTTIEQIRASASRNLFKATTRPYNPFSKGSRWKNVVAASIGRPQYPSWVRANDPVIDDRRAVNPALTTPEKYLELV